MRATGSVDTPIRQNQPPDGTACNKMLTHNLLHILQLNAAVPDSFRVDDNRWSMFTLIETSGFICPDAARQTRCPDRIFETSLQLSFSIRSTRGTGAPRLARIGTYKNVVFES
ncbi:hypothetical protein [Paracidobacterium acidisoli]|uniref:hypothetical protein n=1 Tax=Paracidobacterium acidisoli TaxID=2303751 RepID=UPI0013145A45|nr:hypothetical protein [Paracidobacterium acidisoli]MBT9329726.1 hypothetical protein [Paracidobacterium acidisoli]